MRIITINLNGIRSAARKGFFSWMIMQQPDVVCMQETKAQHQALIDSVFYPDGYYAYFSDAEKKGYSGVGLYTRCQPDRIIRGLGWPEADQEGRYIQVDFAGLSIASLYMPSGSAGEHRQAIKFDFLARYRQCLKKLQHDGRQYIICGDYNIAHKPIDLKNWRANQKNAGFLPEERAWMDELLDKLGFVDAFRVLNQEAEQYTWWSNRGQAWMKNVGWRIDYQVVTPDLKASIKRVEIYKEQRFSDHAPLIIDYELTLL